MSTYTLYLLIKNLKKQKKNITVNIISLSLGEYVNESLHVLTYTSVNLLFLIRQSLKLIINII